ncbi:bleomycin resistance protein [Primorskyibacter sp. S187A]|uniref:bleomycin resistance protein n=1 Tax=Primorskyibacter sp. S187A TaxID=3415130 RepID=UPI003C7E63E6
MAQLLTVAPIFRARDFDRTTAFYASFGYRAVARYEAEGYLILRGDGVELHFHRADAAHAPAPENSDLSAYVRVVDGDVLRQAWAGVDLPREGIPRYVPPVRRPWGMIEAHTVDPDGNLLVYGASYAASPETQGAGHPDDTTQSSAKEGPAKDAPAADARNEAQP